MKDTALWKLRLKLFHKADSFPQRLRACHSLAFLVTLAFPRVAVVTGGIVVCSSTWSPAILRQMSSSAKVLARVDVCRARVGRAGRAIFFRVVGFAFTFPLTLLRGSTCIQSSSSLVTVPADTVEFAPKFRKIITPLPTRLVAERHCWDMYPTANC